MGTIWHAFDEVSKQAADAAELGEALAEQVYRKTLWTRILGVAGFLLGSLLEDIARGGCGRAGKVVLVYPDVAAEINLSKSKWRAGLAELLTEPG